MIDWLAGNWGSFFFAVDVSIIVSMAMLIVFALSLGMRARQAKSKLLPGAEWTPSVLALLAVAQSEFASMFHSAVKNQNGEHAFHAALGACILATIGVIAFRAALPRRKSTVD